MVVTAQQILRDGEKLTKTDTAMDETRLESALGHKQELVRNFGLWSLTSLGIVIAKYAPCFLEYISLTNEIKFLGFSGRHNCCGTPKWWPDGRPLRVDSRQRLLYSDFSIASRTSLVNALRRWCILLVIGTKSQPRQNSGLLHWIFKCLRLATIRLFNELDARE